MSNSRIRRQVRQMIAWQESQQRARWNVAAREGERAAAEAAGAPVIPVEDLAAAFRADKLDAARQLAELSNRQLARQAVAYAAYLSELYQFAGRSFDSAQVFINFQKGIAVYRNSRVEE